VLSFIWTSSLALSVLAILVMTLLIVRRTLTAGRDRRNAEARKRVMTAMIRLSLDGDADTFLETARGVHPAVVADASSEFLDLVRGDERDTVLTALARAGQPEFLRKELKRGNEVRRLQAVELIAAYPVEVARASLQERLDRDGSREVRLAAALELAKAGAVPSLDRLLHKIGYRGQRSRRLAELFRLLPGESEPQLKTLARRQDAPPFLRASAVEALWRRDGLVEATIFTDLTDDPAAEVAAAALRALGRVGQRASLPIVTAKLAHPDWEVRMEAADAVGRLGEPAAAAPLGVLLDDEQWTVRYRAAQSLQRLGEAGLQILRTVAEEAPSRRQRTASLALSEGQPA
jgi:HEAT repeat protein